MENVNSNTPIYVVQKTREEANKEMKEATKRELENLSKALKNRAEKEIPFVEEFFINPLNDIEENDDDDEISISTESTSESTRNLLSAISGLKNNKREKKLEKKLMKKHKKQNNSNSRHDLVDNVVMVEKLKHEDDYQPIISIIRSLVLSEVYTAALVKDVGNVRINFNHFIKNI